MVLHTVGGEAFVLCTFCAVVGVGENRDAAAWGEEAGHFDVFWAHEADEVVEDGVDAVFVERAVVAVAEEIELEAFAFHHFCVGDVADAYFCEVWLTSDGAEGSELGAVEAYPVVALWVFVLECFQEVGVVVCGVESGVSQCFECVVLVSHGVFG